jgi:hypothetical protein
MFMGNADENKLWRSCDEKGRPLFTAIPNPLMNAIISGHFWGKDEMRIFFLICRMSYGFQREETNYLGSDDFSKATGIQKTHLATKLRKMIRDGIIFRGKGKGGEYKYAINLLAYGCTMEHYKKVEAGYKLCDWEYVFDDKSCRFSNCEDLRSDAIVYNPKGYEKKEKLYTKEDIQVDTKEDKKTESTFSSSSRGATKVEAGKDNTSVKPINTRLLQERAEWERQLKELLVAFEADVIEAGACLAIPIMVNHMHILQKAGFPPGEICIYWQKTIVGRKTDKNGEPFNLKDWNQAMRIWQEERKQQGLSV